MLFSTSADKSFPSTQLPKPSLLIDIIDVIWWILHQQAADELGGNLLDGAADEGWGRYWKSVVAIGVFGRLSCGVLTTAGEITYKRLSFTPHSPAMSEEQLSARLAKLRDNADLREKLQGAGDLDVALALAKEAGFDVSKADWLK